MARPAPAVFRTVQVLKYLAQHPRDRFSLSDLSRNLGINKATMHAMLATLHEEGVLVRHPSDKTYTLGPALIGLGLAAAIDASTALDLARPELMAIRNDLDVSVVTTTMVQEDNLILDRFDVDRPIPGYQPVGTQWQIIPPQGREYMAWAPEAEVLAWLERASVRVTASVKRRMFHLLDETRALGYVIMTPELVNLQRLLASLRGVKGAKALQDQVMRLAEELDSGVVKAGSEPSALANAVISPVFGPDGRVLLAVAITGFPADVTPQDVARFTSRLQAGTDKITSLVSGHEGVPDWASSEAVS